MFLNKRQKFIVSCCDPTYGRFATKKEIKACYLKARGHYWYDPEYYEVVAISPLGVKKCFQTDLYGRAPWNRKKKWRQLASKAARLWCKGKKKESEIVEDLLWSLC